MEMTEMQEALAELHWRYKPTQRQLETNQYTGPDDAQTTGYCPECFVAWPCRTAVLAGLL